MKNGILLGAIAGDVIGSVYEQNRTKQMNFQLFFSRLSHFTDDTVMTVANAEWLLTDGDLVDIMRQYGNQYPLAGYGHAFHEWLEAEHPEPYKQLGQWFGNACQSRGVGVRYNRRDVGGSQTERGGDT
jgi:ADP-ribosylglycohydrolase